MTEQPETRQPAGGGTEAQSRRGRHPSEDGEPVAPSAVPEDDEVVPNRHSASAEAALMHWRETHDDT